MIAALTVDGLEFEVRSSARRKTLQLSIGRDGSLVVSAPQGCPPSVMQDFILNKRSWIYTKLAEREALQRPVATKQFVSGEGFPYLGRSYRLLLVEDQDKPLKWERGRFKLVRAKAGRGRRHFAEWYSEHATRWLSRRVPVLAPRVGASPTAIRVRNLGFRWGSCGSDGTLYFHWKTILLPASIVEYIAAHELAHLLDRSHGAKFWQLVERAIPDYRARKTWLAEKATAFALD